MPGRLAAEIIPDLAVCRRTAIALRENGDGLKDASPHALAGTSHFLRLPCSRTSVPHRSRTAGMCQENALCRTNRCARVAIDGTTRRATWNGPRLSLALIPAAHLRTFSSRTAAC